MAAINVGERWGRLLAWFAIGEKKKLFERTIEWAVALAWPIVAYQVVFDRYGWKSQYYSRWEESWFALVLMIAMAGPIALRLFSGTAVQLPKRLTLVGLLVFAVALAFEFRPNFGGVTFMGFYVPMALYAVAAGLWWHWRNKKPSAAKQNRERPATPREETEHSRRS